MASADYTRWTHSGSPYALMRPAKALQRILRGHGLTVFDFPNDAHLTADPPEDHTPFSHTGWPNVSAFGIGHALDVMPRTDSTAGRAENAAIARKLIAARDAGIAGVMWIKYINWTDESGHCWQVSWKSTRTERTSTDKGHIHISGRSDCDNDTRAETYDPMEVTMSASDWHDTSGDTSTSRLTQGSAGYAGQQRDTALAFAWQSAAESRAAALAAQKAAESTLAGLISVSTTLAEIKQLLTALPPGAGGTIDGTYTIAKVAD